MASNWQNIVVQEGQSLFDIALQHYGNAEAVIDLVSDNGLQGVTQQLQAGQVLKVNTASERYNKAIVNYYRANGYLPATQQGVSFEEVLSLTIVPSFQPFSYNDNSHTYSTGTMNFLRIFLDFTGVKNLRFEFTSDSEIDFSISITLSPIHYITLFAKSCTVVMDDIEPPHNDYIGLQIMYNPIPLTGTIKVIKLS